MTERRGDPDPEDPVLRLARERGASIPEGDLLEFLETFEPLDIDPAELQAVLEEQRAERL